MNIFSNLKLNKNNIDSAKLVNTVLGDYPLAEPTAADEGSIRYNGGTLQYVASDGNDTYSWHTVGDSNAQGMTGFSFGKSSSGNGISSGSGTTSISVANNDTIRIDTDVDSNISRLKIYKGSTTGTWVGAKIPTPGAIGIYTDNSPTASQDHMVPIAIPLSTSSLDPTTSDKSNVKVQGNGKGTLSFSNTYYSGGTTVSTNVVKMMRANISIPADQSVNPQPINNRYGIFHLLNSKDVVVQTYFSERKDGSSSYNFTLIQCDVEIVSIDKIDVSVRGIPANGGILKVIVFALTVDGLSAQDQEHDDAIGVTIKNSFSGDIGYGTTETTGVINNPTNRN